MSYPATLTIGDRYADAAGHTYILVAVQSGCPMLLEDFDILDSPDSFEWDLETWDSLTFNGSLTPVEANAEMTRIITERITYMDGVAEVMASVDPANHRVLYNTLAGARHWEGKLADAQRQVNDYSKNRANEYRKIVGIVGTQDKAAKLLRMNQSTLSRALRDR
ncbi:hypothetical protein [Streptomyces prunicolor]